MPNSNKPFNWQKSHLKKPKLTTKEHGNIDLANITDQQLDELFLDCDNSGRMINSSNCNNGMVQRHSILQILKRNKHFLINNLTIIANTLKFIKSSDYNISLTGPSGCGKTFFIDTIKEISKKHTKQEDQKCLEDIQPNKGKIKDILKKVLVLTVRFKEAATTTQNSTELKIGFAKEISLNLIKQIEMNADLNNEQLISLKNFRDQILEQYNFDNLMQLHKCILDLLIRETLEDRLFTKSNFELENKKSPTQSENQEPNTKSKKIYKILLLIDEIDFMDQNQNFPPCLKYGKIPVNRYVNLVSQVLKPYKHNKKVLNFISTSILPLNTNLICERPNIQIKDFAEIFQANSVVGFGEVNVKFLHNVIENTKNSEPKNNLQKFISLLKIKNDFLEEFLDKNIPLNIEEEIKTAFKKIFPLTDYKEGVLQVEGRLLSYGIFIFFSLLWGQVKLSERNKITEFQTLKPDINEGKTLNSPFFLNASRFLNFLMKENCSESINLSDNHHASTDLRNARFWKDYRAFKKIKKQKGGKYLLSIKDKKIIMKKELNNQESRDSTLASLWRLWHGGYFTFETHKDLNTGNVYYNPVYPNYMAITILKKEYQKMITKGTFNSKLTDNEEKIVKTGSSVELGRKQ